MNALPAYGTHPDDWAGDDFDTAPYVERLMESPTFCEEAIGNAARRLYVAYASKDELPHTIDCVIEEYAKQVIDRAIALKSHHEYEEDVCRRAIWAYTQYDGRQAA